MVQEWRVEAILQSREKLRTGAGRMRAEKQSGDPVNEVMRNSSRSLQTKQTSSASFAARMSAMSWSMLLCWEVQYPFRRRLYLIAEQVSQYVISHEGQMDEW